MNRCVIPGLKMDEILNQQINTQNRLLRRFPEGTLAFELGNYQVNILDIHFHLPGSKGSPWHTHSFFEVHLITNSAGQIVTYKGVRTFKQGQILITPPNFDHSWSTESDDLYMYVVKFELNPKRNTQAEPKPIDMALSQLFEIEDFLADYLPEDFGVFDCFLAEISNPRPGLNYMLRGYAQQLVISFARVVNESLGQFSEPLGSEKTERDQLVVLINKYLEDNISKDVSLDTIARFTHRSKRSITRHYKAITGLTIIDKLLQMRLFMAAKLLTDDMGKPVKTVAYEVGMADVSYFCRQFKRFLDSSPSEYRRLNS